jgi:branched-chain amino acid transport system substrate-binding protein
MSDVTKKTGQTRREFLKTMAVAGGAAAAGGLGFPAILRAQPKEIPIGHIHPLSGFLAFDGQELANGLKLAVEEINAAGGIKSMGGAKLKVLTGDSEGKPQVAIREVERLYKAGAVALTGCYQSSVTLVATQIAEKFKVPFVVSVAVSDDVTDRGFDYTFRVQPNARQMSRDTVEYLSEIIKASNSGAKTIAYLHDDTAFGTSLSGHVIDFAPEYGLEVILDVPYSPKSADVTTEVAKIKAAGADIVMDTGYFGDGVRVYKTMHDVRLQCQGIVGCGNGAFSHPKFIEELGGITENVLDGNYRANPLSKLTRQAMAHYKEVYGGEMGASTVFAYVAPYVIADALERAGTTDRVALRDALAATNITEHILPQGPIVFDENGQNKNASAAMMQIRDGEIKVVWPEKYAQTEPIFPVPKLG